MMQASIVDRAAESQEITARNSQRILSPNTLVKRPAPLVISKPEITGSSGESDLRGLRTGIVGQSIISKGGG